MTFQVHGNKSSFAGSKEQGEDFEGRLGVLESGVVYWVFVSTVKLYIGFASYFVKKYPFNGYVFHFNAYRG